MVTTAFECLSDDDSADTLMNFATAWSLEEFSIGIASSAFVRI